MIELFAQNGTLRLLLLALIDDRGRERGRRREARPPEPEELQHRVGVRVAPGERRQIEAGLDEAQDRGVVVEVGALAVLGLVEDAERGRAASVGSGLEASIGTAPARRCPW